MKRNSHDPRAVSHDQKVIERLRDEPRVLLIALRRIAEARGGITQIARKAGVERESLHRALSGRGNPRFSTLSAVAKAVGLRLTVEPV
jgi:probable addiction module antidote protein